MFSGFVLALTIVLPLDTCQKFIPVAPESNSTTPSFSFSAEVQTFLSPPTFSFFPVALLLLLEEGIDSLP